MSSPLDPKRALSLARLDLSRLCRTVGKLPWTETPAGELPAAPDVSVVITCFNYERYLAECLDSVRASDLSALPGGIEVVLVDDASTDDSARLAERYARSHPGFPLRVVRKTFNTGVADARNVGFELARAPHVFVLDADNWIYPRCLGALHQALRGSVHAAAYGMIRKFESGSGRGLGLLSFHEWDVAELVRLAYIDAMALFDRQAVLDLGGYSPHVYGGWADYDLWLRLAADGRSARLVPEILSSYRVHSESMLTTTTHEVLETARSFRQRFPELVRAHGAQDRLFCWPHAILDGREPWPPPAPAAAPVLGDERQMAAPDEVQRLRAELDKARARILFMESSRFWTLRNQWIRVKRRLGYPVTP